MVGGRIVVPHKIARELYSKNTKYYGEDHFRSERNGENKKLGGKKGAKSGSVEYMLRKNKKFKYSEYMIRRDRWADRAIELLLYENMK